jgi:Na+/H+ antiporter NhaC
MEGGSRNGSMTTATKVLAAVIAVAAITIAATTGDSWAVRAILVLVAGEVADRLWRA